MTQRSLATALILTLLVLMVGMVPVSGRAAEPVTAAPAVQAPPATSPAAPAPEPGKPVEKPFGGGLFTPAQVPMCSGNFNCFGDGTPCGPDGQGTCYAPSGGCGVCLF